MPILHRNIILLDTTRFKFCSIILKNVILAINAVVRNGRGDINKVYISPKNHEKDNISNIIENKNMKDSQNRCLKYKLKHMYCNYTLIAEL